MILTIISIVLAGLALVGSIVAIQQTRRYQDRAWLHARWDRIGLAGGIHEVWYGSGADAHSVPYMKISITNHGREFARMLDLSSSTVVVGRTQETDDGVRPYTERDALGPGETWELEVPLIRLHESFDHPFTVEDPTLQRPTLELRWFEYYSKRMKKQQIELDGDWLANYEPFHRNAAEIHTAERSFIRERCWGAIGNAVDKQRFR